MAKKAVIYTRVSTDVQAEKGYSLKDQEDKLRRYCQQNDIIILQHFQEDYSAKDFNRPEWKLLMKFLKKNKNEVDLFMFAKWDRFSRNLEEGLRVLNKIKSLKIKIHCLENNIDDSVPENKLIQAIMLIIPEIENERKSLSVTAGMRRAMKEGKWPRQAPIGYINARDEDNNKVIMPHPDMAPLIRRAFLEMSKGIKSQQEIRLDLVKSGLRCSKNNFSLLLKNQFYIGKILIPAYKDEAEITIDGVHESIVEESVFYKVQDILFIRKKKNNLPDKKVAKPELPLRGYLLCHHCGKKMTGSASKGNGGRYFYYHCNYCGSRFRANTANQAFEKLLNTLKEEIKELFLAMVKDLAKESLVSEKLEQSRLNKELNRQNIRIQRLEDSFLDGDITGDAYSKLSKKTNNEIAKIKLQQGELKQSKKEFNKALLNGVNVIMNIRDLYLESDITDKQRLIGSIFPRKFKFEENKVRTDQINEVVKWVMKNSKGLDNNEKGQQRSNSKLSCLVNPKGLEPPTS